MKKRRIFPAIAAFWSASAVAVSGEFVESDSFLEALKTEVQGAGMDMLIVVLALIVLYCKLWDTFREGRRWITHLLSLLFSCFMLIGLTYSTLGSWAFILGNPIQFAIAMLTFGGFFILFDLCLACLYQWLASRSLYRQKPSRPFPAFVEKHYFLCCFLVIYVCWLPYMIFLFPGSVPADGYRQLDMYMGGEPFTTRHAWVLTMLVGFLMSVGRKVSDNAGVFLVVFLTSVVSGLCYATVCSKLKKWRAPKAFCVGTVWFFALLPVFGAYAQALIKDSIFSPLFALFMTLYMECAIPALQRKNEAKLKKQLVILTVVGLLVCFTRNNGIHMVFPAMLLLVFLMAKKERVAALLLSAVVLAGHGVSEKVVAPALGIEPISSRVFFSIPFQQTARYLRSYPEDVTTEEKRAINGVLRYKKLGQLYNPDISDPVKATYRTEEVTIKKLIRYFKAWYTMFLRHPGVYVEATLNGTYGYYYPFHHCNALSPYRFYMKAFDHYQFDYHYVFPRETRRVITRYAYTWNAIPGLSQLCNSGTYTWALMILAGYLIYRKRWKGILGMAAPFLNVLICIASPVNGLFRYVYPLVACMPVVLYWCLGYGEKEFMEELEDVDQAEQRTITRERG